MRQAATAVLLIAAWVTVSAQVVPVGQEPHHRIVYEDASLRVLDVNIPPGTTTLDHSHDHDLVTVSIGQADTRIRVPGSDWGPVRPRRPLGDTSTVEYAGKRGVHTIENVGPDPYRLIAVENVKQSGWHAAPAVAGSAVRQLTEARAFRASSVRVKPGAAVRRAHKVPTVVVLVSGEALLAPSAKEPRPLGPAARWAVVGAANEFTLTTRGEGEAHLVEIEVF